MTSQDEVLRAMARGLKDEAIARELGVSVRTVRRHVPDFMNAADAPSRFKAGVVWASSQPGTADCSA